MFKSQALGRWSRGIVRVSSMRMGRLTLSLFGLSYEQDSGIVSRSSWSKGKFDTMTTTLHLKSVRSSLHRTCVQVYNLAGHALGPCFAASPPHRCGHVCFAAELRREARVRSIDLYMTSLVCPTCDPLVVSCCLHLYLFFLLPLPDHYKNNQPTWASPTSNSAASSRRLAACRVCRASWGRCSRR
jgi:hypothetical protein